MVGAPPSCTFYRLDRVAAMLGHIDDVGVRTHQVGLQTLDNRQRYQPSRPRGLTLSPCARTLDHTISSQRSLCANP